MRSREILIVATLACFGCSNTPQKPGTQSVAKPSLSPEKVETGIKLARIQERQGSVHKARQIYEDLIESNPEHPVLCHRLAVVYTRLDQPDQADKLFLKSDQLQPNNADLYSDYGYALYLRGELSQAESWLSKAHAIQPGNERTIGNLAIVVGLQGRTSESLAFFRQYLDEAEAQANLAYVLTQRGDMKAAKERYSKALSIDPEHKPAQHALLQLAELRESSTKEKMISKSHDGWKQKQPSGRANVGTDSL